jgi:hypothetical protein
MRLLYELDFGPETVWYENLRLQLPPLVSPAHDSGDRTMGNIRRRPPALPAVKRQLTPERLKENFGGLLKGPIRRFEIDHLRALNFVMERALEGGVNESLNLDSHGKS